MTGIAQRVERLERTTACTGRLIMIEGPNSYGIDQALSELGIELVNNDLAIYICRRGKNRPLRRL